MNSENFDLSELQAQLLGKNPRKIITEALSRYQNIAISFSGAEDVVLIDMAHLIRSDIAVFTLDTGRLNPETYQFLDRVRSHYNLELEVLYPDPEKLENLVKQKGLFSFYQDGHKECCSIRKVGPLNKKLLTLDAWITGQRKDQSLETRQNLLEVEEDNTVHKPAAQLIKFNPLTNWSSRQVWDYIDAYDVPFNELHRRGYRSIGCEPCTRPTLPAQHEREGRWWWEDANKKECGLHATNLKTSKK